MDHSNVIKMLSMWVTPEMWDDQFLYLEIESLVDKLSSPAMQLNERELYLAQELTDGLLEGTEASLEKTDEFESDIRLVIEEITQFQSLLLTKGCNTLN